MAQEKDRRREIIRPSIEELESGLKFDVASLDAALIQQPTLYYHVAQALTLAISDRDLAKQNLQELEAELDAGMRRDATNAGEKLTEVAISRALIQHAAVKRANANLLELNKKVGQLTALQDAFRQRSYVLGNLVDLHSAGYFADASHQRAQQNIRNNRIDTARETLRSRTRQRA